MEPLAFVGTAVFVLLGLMVLPRITFTILGFAIHPLLGVLVAVIAVCTLFAD